MDKPVILVVDDELGSLSLIERELKKRYGDDYRVVAKQSVQVALDLLRGWREAGAKVALVLADKGMPEMEGKDFLGEVRLIEPLAKRVLLVDWGDPEAPQAIYEGCAYNQIEHFLRKPWHSGPDEQFHHEIAELLYQWSRSFQPVFEAVKIVGERLSSRSYELRDLLGRNNVPYGFYPVDSDEGTELLADAGLTSSAKLPVTIVFGGKVHEDPTNREVSEALGVKSRSEQDGLRPRGDRRRAGRPCFGRLRVVGGSQHHGRGARGAGRPGGAEHVDPQLPRLHRRHQRGRARLAGLSAGVGDGDGVPHLQRGGRHPPGRGWLHGRAQR